MSNRWQSFGTALLDIWRTNLLGRWAFTQSSHGLAVIGYFLRAALPSTLYRLLAKSVDLLVQPVFLFLGGQLPEDFQGLPLQTLAALTLLSTAGVMTAHRLVESLNQRRMRVSMTDAHA